jgi:hypothetical protein
VQVSLLDLEHDVSWRHVGTIKYELGAILRSFASANQDSVGFICNGCHAHPLRPRNKTLLILDRNCPSVEIDPLPSHRQQFCLPLAGERGDCYRVFSVTILKRH